MRKICFLFLILLTALNIFSKENNFELGKKYFEEKKYEQAEKYYKIVLDNEIGYADDSLKELYKKMKKSF